MIKPTKVEPREGYRIWLCYSDGVDGEIDLSSLAGHGAFKIGNRRGCFKTALTTPYGAITWGKDVKLCPDALYMRLTGKYILKAISRADASSFVNALTLPFLLNNHTHVF